MKEWIDYDGEESEGVIPVSGETLVFVRFRCGAEEPDSSPAHFFSWKDHDRGYDIVAYALAEKEESAPEKTGGSTPNQYRISLNLPMTEDRTGFVQVDLEAMDVIDALDLSGNLKDVQKALFRLDKKAGVSVQYDLTKSVFYLVRELKKRGYISHAKFWKISDYISKALKGD
jgi:hypothetical protein